MKVENCLFCDSDSFRTVFDYSSPPAGETVFPFSSSPEYKRKIISCERCGHYYSIHNIDLSAIYSGEYVESTYGSKMEDTFNRIVSLDPSSSDNYWRVERVDEFARNSLSNLNESPRLLDIGSGLGVFPYLMKTKGWLCHALDPDEQAVEHIRSVVGVHAIQADFLTYQPQESERFDLITFNKVLEHVEDPTFMLQKASQFLNESGLVYVELPDGEAAELDGEAREEFYIEHHHIFSMSSFVQLASRAGFRTEKIERIQEPSTKYTLCAFLKLSSNS